MSKREMILLSIFVILMYLVNLYGCYKDSLDRSSWYFDNEIIWGEVPC